MHTASVGFHCPECMKSGKQRVYRVAPTFDPLATKVLIAINVVVWIWASVVSGTTSRIAGEVLRDGGLFGPRVADGEWYRLLTSGFLHDGMFHLAFNMYALWILGGQLERVLQRPRFVALYFAALLGGSFGVVLLDPLAITVGASGAVFGLFGATAVIQRSAGLSIWATRLGPVLGLNLLFTFAVPRISIGGHVGGLIAGALVALVHVRFVRARRREWQSIGATAAIAVFFVIAAVAVSSNPLF